MPTNKTEQQALDKQFIAASTKYLVPGNVTVNVDGVVYNAVAVQAAVQAKVDARAKVNAARGNLSQAVAQEEATVAANQPIYDGAKQMVLVMYKSNIAVLTEFGLTLPKKAGPKTVEVKQAALAKIAATRTARHTMGPKQKAKIHGVVDTAPSATTSAPVAPPVAAANGVTTPGASGTGH